MFDCNRARIPQKTIPINHLINNNDRVTADLELQRKDPAHEQRAYYKEYSSSLLAGAVACDAAAAAMCWPLSPCFLANIINNVSVHQGRVRDAVTLDLHMAASDRVLVDVDADNRFVPGSVHLPGEGRLGDAAGSSDEAARRDVRTAQPMMPQ